jgi:hypothetical protein
VGSEGRVSSGCEYDSVSAGWLGEIVVSSCFGRERFNGLGEYCSEWFRLVSREEKLTWRDYSW